jgi:hypothetical protein
VRAADAGIVVGDSPDEMAAAIRKLVAASPEQRDAWDAAASEAARRNAWSVRAHDVLEALGVAPSVQ